MFHSSHRGELTLLSSPDADIYLQGAHLSRFRDWLFLSKSSHFALGQPIRGGVPVIFPWFGPNKIDANAPSHGLVRTQTWQAVDVGVDAVTLVTQSDIWRVQMKFGLGDELRMRFEVENLSDKPFGFECALHTYFAVDDIRNVAIAGLDGKTYLDKTQNYRRLTQSGDLTFEGETDCVYLDSPGPITIHGGARTLQIVGETGWRSTVIWNPWRELAAQMADLGDEDWKRYVCVECGAIADDAVTLEAGANYALDVSVSAQL